MAPSASPARATRRLFGLGGVRVWGFKAHRLLYHSTLGLSVIKKKEEPKVQGGGGPGISVFEAHRLWDHSTLGLSDRGGGGRESVYLRLIDSCIAQLQAQGPSRTCNANKEEG